MAVNSNTGLPFMKMHGLGNDFVVIDTRLGVVPMTACLASALGDRHRGVGFDQLAEIQDSEDTDVQIKFWNADGSLSGACGNATRCIADHLLPDQSGASMTLTTPRGPLSAERLSSGLVRVNMGHPQFDWCEIPLSSDVDIDALPLDGKPSAIGMGNPHCVFFVENVDDYDPAVSGPPIEMDPLYPQATNVEFARILAPDRIRMRVWERGTGITLACGSGACATLVAAARRGLTGKRATLVLDGGELDIEWTDDGVWMSGPSAHVFSGTLTPEFLGQF
jgi:diaminopimelate epimerase